MREGLAGNAPPDAQMIKSGLDCPQADLDIPEAFPVGELGKCRTEVLVPAGKADQFVIAIVSIDAFWNSYVVTKSINWAKIVFPKFICCLLIDEGVWHIRKKISN